MDSTGLQMTERKFKLTGKMCQEQFDKNIVSLINTIAAMKFSTTQGQEIIEDHTVILELLRSGNYCGNEAGAAQYSGFASTEIEEAIRRMGSGDCFEYLRYRHHWHKYPHELKVREFPIHLGLESSSVCDLRCKMCFQSDPTFRKRREEFGLMDYGLYTRIIDEGIDNGLCSIKLSIRGEPILNPRLPEMITYARKKGLLDVMFNTNANQLDETKSRNILSAGPTLIIFSVDADTKNIYESIRVGADFERVVQNIIRFHQIRENEFPYSKTKTRLQMTVVSETRGEIDAVRERWQDMVDQIAIKEHLIRQYESNAESLRNATPCRLLWQRLDIHFDGSVWLCDNDFYGKLCVGNVNDESIYDIWHGSIMKGVRESHKQGHKNNFAPCMNCDGL